MDQRRQKGERTIKFSCLVADVAHMLLLASVAEQVGLEVVGAAKDPLADLTLVLLAGRLVGQLVALQVRRQSEILLADVTHEVPLSSVHQHVGLEVAGADEQPQANQTRELGPALGNSGHLVLRGSRVHAIPCIALKNTK